MDLHAALYHGVLHNVRRVIDALGPERTDKGLTAFEDGQSNWSQCFFARAFAPEVMLSHLPDPEGVICRELGILNKEGKPNRVPVRLVWRTFDSCSHIITRQKMYEFISSVRDESRPSEVMELLRGIDYTGAEDTPISMTAESCVRG